MHQVNWLIAFQQAPCSLQATQQAQPQILAALSRTLGVLLVATPDASLPQLARFAHGLQASPSYSPTVHA